MGAFVSMAYVWIFIHGIFVLFGAWLFRVDVHTLAIASAANIGGAASAPIVAAHHRESLVPASILAREMNIRVVDTLCITAYDEQVKSGTVNVLKIPEQAEAVGGEGWLLIDDLVDTGTTARKAREILPKAHFCTVYAKPKGLPVVDTYVAEVEQDVWVFFPWDTEPQYVAPLAGDGDI